MASELETPPLTRGRLSGSEPASAVSGNTPAYAGKTSFFFTPMERVWKHPRLRGEDQTHHRLRLHREETPPLTRGRPRTRPTRRRHPRNTPAYAGKTRPAPLEKSDPWKHPRLRGEDRSRYSPRVRVQETPPLTRGRQGRTKTRSGRCGNTPAYAGKTDRRDTDVDGRRKHPRLRGEDSAARRAVRWALETPPLTRGRLRK